jgi:hypothetical protein
MIQLSAFGGVTKGGSCYEANEGNAHKRAEVQRPLARDGCPPITHDPIGVPSAVQNVGIGSLIEALHCHDPDPE